MDIPATVFVAFGAVLAALIAGFFSFVSLVSSKENKISEFRLGWIDGLRDDVARFTSGLTELVRLNSRQSEITVAEWLELGAQPYRDAREALSRIQLRLNPDHVANKADGLDAKLMTAVVNARKEFNKAADDEISYGDVIDHVDAVRSAAAPLLKEQWERVKKGEATYRRARAVAWVTLLLGFLALIAGSSYFVFQAGSMANNSFRTTPHSGIGQCLHYAGTRPPPRCVTG